MEISESTWAFIAKHRCEDVRDVALHAKRGDGIDLSFALEQIAGWQRASVKLPDWAACDGLIFRVKGQNVCLARRVAGVRFGLFECRLSGCSRCR